MSNTQLTKVLGHCQCCGRIQAVMQNGYTSGLMSKHGYTVEHSWFKGICDGQNFKPLEQEREALDAQCRALTERAEDLRKMANDLESGKKRLTLVRGHYNAKTRDYDMIPWSDAPAYKQREALQQAVGKHRSMADSMIRFVNDLLSLALRVHGEPLIEQKKETPKAPIRIGEQRVRGGKVLTVTRVAGPRIYVGTWWVGVAAWRKLELATAETA